MIDDRFTPGYVATPEGRVHVVQHGAGVPLLLLHQTPRSWSEFRDLMPLLPGVRCVALDMVGFGASAPVAEYSIEQMARSALGVLDALGIPEAAVLGHHTGGVVACELAAQVPERVRALLLSSTPFVDQAGREVREARPAIDAVPTQPDGSHLTAMWQRRQAFYPRDRPDLLRSFVRDALTVEDRLEAGHEAVARYRAEDRLGRYGGPVLCIAHDADPYAWPERQHVVSAFPQAETAVVAGGTVAAMDQVPERVAPLVSDFLDRVWGASRPSSLPAR